MSEHLPAKYPADTVERRWTVPVGADDAPRTVAAGVATGVTVDSALIEGAEIVFSLSGGSAGQTAAIPVTVTTNNGLTITETLYLPIVAADSAAITVRDVVSFALRKITGLGETPDPVAMDDGIERLSDMLEAWRATGADIGAPRPLTASTVLYVPHSVVTAVKNNLIMQLADLYGAEISPVVVANARAGLAHVRQRNLPDDRPGVFY